MAVRGFPTAEAPLRAVVVRVGPNAQRQVDPGFPGSRRSRERGTAGPLTRPPAGNSGPEVNSQRAGGQVAPAPTLVIASSFYRSTATRAVRVFAPCVSSTR
jgi:hypothetical protein